MRSRRIEMLRIKKKYFIDMLHSAQIYKSQTFMCVIFRYFSHNKILRTFYPRQMRNICRFGLRDNKVGRQFKRILICNLKLKKRD